MWGQARPIAPKGKRCLLIELSYRKLNARSEGRGNPQTGVFSTGASDGQGQKKKRPCSAQAKPPSDVDRVRQSRPCCYRGQSVTCSPRWQPKFVRPAHPVKVQQSTVVYCAELVRSLPAKQLLYGVEHDELLWCSCALAPLPMILLDGCTPDAAHALHLPGSSAVVH